MQSGTYQDRDGSPTPLSSASAVFKPPREPFSICREEEKMHFVNDEIPSRVDEQVAFTSFHLGAYDHNTV